MPKLRSTSLAGLVLLVTWAAFAAVQTAAAQTAAAPTTAATFDLVGDVASVREYRTFPGTTERELLVERAFDASGRVTELTTFSYSFRDGSLSGRQVSTYDERGLRQAIVAYDADGEMTGQTAFRYDDEGHQVSEVAVDVNGVETRRIDVERAGDLVIQVWLQQGEPFRRNETRVDAEGRELEVRRFDDQGRLMEERSYVEPGSIYDFVLFDDEGVIEERGTVRSGPDGRESAISYDADGALGYEVEWRYDDAGWLLERRDTDADGSVTVYTTTYTLDDVGNWIRFEQTEDMGNGPEVYEVRDREVTYR